MKNILLLTFSLTLFSLSISAATLTITAPNIGQQSAKIKSVGLHVNNNKFSISIITYKTNYDNTYSCRFISQGLRNNDMTVLFKVVEENIKNDKYVVICNATNDAFISNNHIRVSIGGDKKDTFSVRQMR